MKIIYIFSKSLRLGTNFMYRLSDLSQLFLGYSYKAENEKLKNRISIIEKALRIE